MLSAAMLNIIEDAAAAIVVYAEDMNEYDFRASRVIRKEVDKHLLALADTAANLPADIKAALSEIDWQGWQALGRILHGQTAEDPIDAAWFAMQSQAPATLIAIRLYRKTQPELFRFQA